MTVDLFRETKVKSPEQHDAAINRRIDAIAIHALPLVEHGLQYIMHMGLINCWKFSRCDGILELTID
jgi:hypothetical protein